MKRFPWRFAVYLIAGLYLFCDLRACRGPLYRLIEGRGLSTQDLSSPAAYAALVYGRPITQLELSEALRDQLWARGESWTGLSPAAQKQTRWLVLETLVNDRLIHANRIMNGLDAPVTDAAVRRELDQFHRQFTTEQLAPPSLVPSGVAFPLLIPSPGGNYAPRLQAQQFTEAGFTESLREQQDDRAWIEEKIRHRLAEVTEAQARAWLDDHRAEVRVPERWRAAHLYLTRHEPQHPERLAEITAIRNRITAGDLPFEDACRQFSDDERTKQRGGDLGWFSADRMPEDFIAAIRALQPGQLSEPAATRLGWHLIRVTAHEPGRDALFDEARDEVMALLQNQRRQAAVQSLIGELRQRATRPTQFLFYRNDVINAATPAPEVPGGR